MNAFVSTEKDPRFETGVARQLWQFAAVREDRRTLAASERSLKLLKAMAQLEPRLHQVVFHMMVAGRSSRETAEVLDMCESEINLFLAEARDNMHSQLTAGGQTP